MGLFNKLFMVKTSGPTGYTFTSGTLNKEPGVRLEFDNHTKYVIMTVPEAEAMRDCLNQVLEATKQGR